MLTHAQFSRGGIFCEYLYNFQCQNRMFGFFAEVGNDSCVVLELIKSAAFSKLHRFFLHGFIGKYHGYLHYIISLYFV